MSKTTCPTFRPTIEEFADFKGFIARIEGTLYDDDIGICKIIPPAGLSKEFKGLIEWILSQFFLCDESLRRIRSLTIYPPNCPIVLYIKSAL